MACIKPSRIGLLNIHILTTYSLLILIFTIGCIDKYDAPLYPEINSKNSRSSLQQSAYNQMNIGVEKAFPNISFDRMVHLTYPNDKTNRLFLVLQQGQILVFANETTVNKTELFLDITDRVNDRQQEEGLLGLAFDPKFKHNGYFYTYYTNYSVQEPKRHSIISRFSISKENPNRADPNSEKIILEFPQPEPNHNGGHIIFGKDGFLYIGVGDGGGSGDPNGNSQNTYNFLGSILRIDVSTIDTEGNYSIPPDNPFVIHHDEKVKKEIWAYGLRNPWRFDFDDETGDLFVGDVGQFLYEEINLIKPGYNYGWNLMEAKHCFRSEQCEQKGLEPPIFEYGRSEGCSIIGGHVYRGNSIEFLYGTYIFGDFCSGKIWSIRYDNEEVTDFTEISDLGSPITAFGEDQQKQIYILSLDGNIYKFHE